MNQQRETVVIKTAEINSAVIRAGMIGAALAAALLARPVLAQKVIAIAVNGPHPTLEQAQDGFKEELARQGFRDGQEVVYRKSMGNFNPALIAQLLAQAESSNPALILTVTTPVTQAARSVIKNRNIPVVFSIVSDPVKAQVVPAWERGSEQFVGVSNLYDMGAVLAFGRQLFPNARTVGLPFNPGEANDVAHMEMAKAAAAKLGLTVREVAVDTVNEIAQRVHALRGSDYIYILPSNLLMPAAPAIASAASQINIPLIAGGFPIVKEHGAAASYAVSYTKLGHISGRMAADILRGKKPADMANYRPVAEDHEAFFSARQMAKYKLQVPAAYRDCKCIFE